MKALLAFRRRSLAACAVATAALAVAGLAGCGGGGTFGNPDEVQNPGQSSGQRLSFAYYQRCIHPILLAQLQVNLNGTLSTNSCAGGGCHSSTSGTGGALRIEVAAANVDLGTAPDVIRDSAMYRNYFSAYGSSVPGAPSQSRLLTKPLVQGVLHGGGIVFADANDPNARLIRYWINRPAPEGQDEFSAASANMFTPPDPATGACNTE